MAGRTRRGFGYLRRLPSGRWQASYLGPDGARHLAPTTFLARQDADIWHAARTAIRKIDMDDDLTMLIGPPAMARRWRSACLT